MRKKKTHKTHTYLRFIGESLRNRRIDRLLSQEELAGRAQVHRTYITDVENGYRNVSILTLLRLTTALEVPLSKVIVDAEYFMSEGDQDE